MKVSVVIPCYNVAPYVRRSLNSVFGQTYDDIEVICVDDGSTDDTLQVLQAIDREHPGRFAIIRQENKGACAARNTGLHSSSGEYIQFLDADDELLNGKIAHQVDVALREQSPDVIIGGSRTLAPDGRVAKTVELQQGTHDDWLDLMRHALNITSADLWKRDAVMAVGGWTEGLGSSQEYDLMFRMLRNGARFWRDGGILTVIHQRPGESISHTNPAKNWRRFVDLRARILRHVQEHGLSSDLRPYHQILFDAIRILYPHDRQLAIEQYRRLIPRDFKPGLSTATGRGYLLLHDLLGFDMANRLRNLSR